MNPINTYHSGEKLICGGDPAEQDAQVNCEQENKKVDTNIPSKTNAVVYYDVASELGCAGGIQYQRVAVYTETGVFSRFDYIDSSGAVSVTMPAGFTLGPCGSKIDPELACISNDGGTTIVTGVVVYDISVNPPTETIYLNGTDVTGTYVKVPCEKNLDFETKETCYQDITDPNIKYTRVDWFEKDNLVVPVSTVWFDVTAGTYSATAPANIVPCSDGCKEEIFATHIRYINVPAIPANFVAYEMTSTLASMGLDATNGYFHLIYGVLNGSTPNPAIGPALNDYFANSQDGVLFTDVTTIQAVVDYILPQIGLTVGEVIYAVNTANEPIWFLSANAVAELSNNTYLHIYFGNVPTWNGYTQKADVTVPASNPNVLLGGGSGCVSIQEIKQRNSCTGIETYRYVVEDGNGNLVPVTDVYPSFIESDVLDNCDSSVIVDIVRCDNTVEQVQVKEIVGIYDLNKDYKHTERVYDNITATLGGTITTITAGTNVLFNFTNVIATNWVGANYLIDFGNGFTDIGGNPSFDYVNEPDGDYEIKVYRMFVYPEGARFYLIGGVEVSLVSGSITVFSTNPAPVNRSITYTQKEVFQDYCGQTPVGSPYLADGSVASIAGTLSTTYREEISEWQGVTDANNTSTSQQLIAKSGILSIANGTFATNLGPDGTIWNNPGGLRSVTIRARRSNGTDAIPGSGANQVLVQTTDNKGVLLTNESVTFSVEDGNIQDFVYVDTLNNAAALIIYNRL